MANKQSVPTNHIGGSNLLKQTRSVLQQYRAPKENVEDGDVDAAQTVLNRGEKILMQRKKVVDENMRLRAVAALQAEKMQLMNAANIDDFNQIEKTSKIIVESEFADHEGKNFWNEYGAEIMKAHQNDVAKLKESKAQEFGKNSLDEMLANSQNMLAAVSGEKGNLLLSRGVNAIEETPFLSEAEKEDYRLHYLRSGILNLALHDSEDAHKMAALYLQADDELKAQIDKTAQLKEEGIRGADERKQENVYLNNLREGVSLWQAKERGEINAAAYYVLTAWNKENMLWGDENREEEYPLSWAYLLAKKYAHGEKLSKEEMCDMQNYLMAAYKQKAIDLDRATTWQNMIFEAQGEGVSNHQLKLAENLADRVLFADVEEEGEEAQKFMEEKAKLSFEIYAAYKSELEAMTAEATAEGKVLTPAGQHKIAREAIEKVAEGYGFEAGEEEVDFNEIREIARDNYHGENRVKLWQRFYERAPYVKDKKELMIKLASTLDAKERNSRDVQPFETAEEDGEHGEKLS